MTVRDRIEQVCRDNNKLGRGILSPFVCPYCGGCALQALVVGVAGDDPGVVLPIAKDKEDPINAWLDKIEASQKQRVGK